jgi:hypothetical protein
VLRIYRVTTSNVSFLNSGNLLHTIFPRSQCWCVDGQSVFVLRIRQDSYYRMELPYTTEEDKQKIEQFKSVLGQVLQYEKTQCPFTRSFDVELPERPKTPPRKLITRRPTQKAKKWMFDKTWMPESSKPRPTTSAPTSAPTSVPTFVPESSDSGTVSSPDAEDDTSSICTDNSEMESDAAEAKFTLPQPQPSPRVSVAERAMMFQNTRSVSTPMSLGKSGLVGSPEHVSETPKAAGQTRREHAALERNASTDAVSLLSSADSFYSLDTTLERTPSPPFLDAEADFLNPWVDNPSEQDIPRGRSKHRRQASELTIRACSADDAERSAPVTPLLTFGPMTTPTTDVRPSSAPSTPPLVSDSDEDSLELSSMGAPTPPNMIRMKRLTGASQRRAYSPMPQPQNLFCPPKHQPNQKFTTALVRKTCEIVLGPPAHLVSLMLRIAASISDGFGFATYRVRRNEKIPCSWESSGDESEWPEEDDFGIPLNNMSEPVARRQEYPAALD